MLELPPLPLEAVEGREPVLRLRHAITNTNYYVQIFAESAPGVAPLALHIAGEDETEAPYSDHPAPGDHLRTSDPPSSLAPAAGPSPTRNTRIFEDDDLFTPDDIPDDADIPGLDADPRLTAPQGALLTQVPASQSDLDWTPTNRLGLLPLTGLTRKVLQRLGVMTLPRVQLS